MRLERIWMLFEVLKSSSVMRGGPLLRPKLGWGIAAVAIVFWTLLCAAGYGVVLLVGNWAITGASYGATWNVEIVEFVTATLSILQSVGHIMVAALWALVSLGIVAVTWFLTRFRFGRAG